MPIASPPTDAIDDLNRNVDSFGADVLTSVLPKNLHLHDDRIDTGEASVSTDDPAKPTRDFVTTLFDKAPDTFFSEGGKQLPLFIDQVATLCLLRAGYTLETGVGLQQPNNAAALDPAGVALMNSAAHYGRVRALSNMAHIALLPKQLAVLRFRRAIEKVFADALRCASRLVVEAEVELDKTVRPAVTTPAPLATMEPLATDLAPLFDLTGGPAAKAQATRATKERAHADGKAEGFTEGFADGRAEGFADGRSEAEAALRGQPAPAAGKTVFAKAPLPQPRAGKGRKRPR